MRAIALMLMLFGMAGAARADVVFTLDPTRGQNGQIVNLRVDETDEQCFPAGDPGVVRDGNTVRVRFDMEDFLPPGTPDGVCPAYRVTPRFHPLGTFASGNYTVEVTTCSNPPIGPPCRVEATLNLSVFGSNGTFTIPTMSVATAIAMVVAMVMVGLVWRGRLS